MTFTIAWSLSKVVEKFQVAEPNVPVGVMRLMSEVDVGLASDVLSINMTWCHVLASELLCLLATIFISMLTVTSVSKIGTDKMGAAFASIVVIAPFIWFQGTLEAIAFS